MPFVFPGGLGVSKQALQQFQVIFGRRAEYHLIVHDTELTSCPCDARV